MAYKEPFAIYLIELWDKERERSAELANKKLEERRLQVNQIRASGRTSLSGSLAEALGMVPPLRTEPDRYRTRRKGPVLVQGRRVPGRPKGSRNRPKSSGVA